MKTVYGLGEKEVQGRMYLLKNDRFIREHRFHSRWDRRSKMEEWRLIVQKAEPAEYFIKLILDNAYKF
jgi:hypothetical protein